MRLSSLVLSTSLFALSVMPAVAAPRVVASIVPLHSLVASVMDGVGNPELLLSGQTSEHQASYSPQQIKLLGDADAVFIIGHGLELKLDQISGSEAVKGKRFVELADIPGLKKLPIRLGGGFEKHDHDHDHDHGEEEAGKDGHEHEHADAAESAEKHEHEHEHEMEQGKASFDPHLWLDPDNAKMMAAAIAAELSRLDPENAARYAANAGSLAKELDTLAADLSQELAGVKDKPFIVQHDAYQYFEARFGLSAAGSVADISANDPSAQRLKDVREKLKAVQAVCVFREPQFSDKAAKTIVEGTSARDGVLDPIGATLSPGKAAYGTLLRNLSSNMKACLSG